MAKKKANTEKLPSVQKKLIPEPQPGKDEVTTTKMTMGGKLVVELSKGAYTSVASALKEYVSNSWDARAGKIHVRIYNPSDPATMLIEIEDDGEGMNKEDLTDKFFRLGRERRRDEGATVKGPTGKTRYVHGRKGLGKFAGLRVANQLEVLTWHDGVTHHAFVQLKEMEENPNKDPLIHWLNNPPRPRQTDSGTIIRLRGIRRAVNIEDLRWDLSVWFEFGDEAEAWLEHYQGVGPTAKLVGKWKITRELLFENVGKTTTETLVVEWAEIPEAGAPGDKETKEPVKKSEKVTVKWGWLPESETKVESLVSVFSGTRALSTEEKFGISRGYTNMFGIYRLVAKFDAPWIDRIPGVDPADLTREKVNWDAHPALAALREAGEKWVIATSRKGAKSPQGKSKLKETAEDLVKKDASFKTWSEPQKTQLVAMVTNYAQSVGLNEDRVKDLIDLFAFVIQNQFIILFIEGLQKGGKKSLDEFVEIATSFSATEMTSLLQVTKNKLIIAKQLAEVIKDQETTEVAREGKIDITTFLARNPWIFDPELRIDHRDVGMKTIILKADGTGATVLNSIAEKFYDVRPDLTSYKGPTGKPLVIELKAPRVEMSAAEAQRVVVYRAALLKKYPEVEIVVVSGKYETAAENILTSLPGVRLMPYAEVFQRAEAQLKEFIEKLDRGLETVAPEAAALIAKTKAAPSTKKGAKAKAAKGAKSPKAKKPKKGAQKKKR